MNTRKMIEEYQQNKEMLQRRIKQLEQQSLTIRDTKEQKKIQKRIKILRDMLGGTSAAIYQMKKEDSINKNISERYTICK